MILSRKTDNRDHCVRQSNLKSQVVGGIPSQSGSLPSLSSFLFLPCFDTLIFTICPVRPITGVLHFYASAVWANRAYSCCRQTALSPVPWLTCATKQACVRNQESTSWANHFNRHLPTKNHFKWGRPRPYFVWHSLFLLRGTLVWLRQNRQVGLCAWDIIFFNIIFSKFFCTSMAKYYFPRTAVRMKLLKSEYCFRLPSKFLYRW